MAEKPGWTLDDVVVTRRQYYYISYRFEGEGRVGWGDDVIESPIGWVLKMRTLHPSLFMTLLVVYPMTGDECALWFNKATWQQEELDDAKRRAKDIADKIGWE